MKSDGTIGNGIPPALTEDALDLQLGRTFIAGAAESSVTIKTMAFKTSSGTKKVNLFFDWVTEGAATIILLEGPTWTTGTGVAGAPVNKNYTSTNESILQEDKTNTPNFTANGYLTDPTGVAGGILKFADKTWTDKRSGGSCCHGGQGKFILNPDTTYALILVSNNGAQGLLIRMDFSEKEDVL